MRFEVVESNIIENGWFIKDNAGKVIFSTSTNKFVCDFYCKALNKVYEEGLKMKKEKFTYNMHDGFLEDGEKIGIWEVLLYLNNLYEENKQLKEKMEVLK